MENLFYNNSSLPFDSVSYIQRETDRGLKQILKKDKFCCVYSPRMMGKTSLMKKANADLCKEGYLCTEIDACAFIDPLAESWYYTIFDKMLTDFHLEFDLASWWAENLHLVSSIKFIEFIQVVLSQTDKEIVIFIDEMDAYIRAIKDDPNSIYNNILSSVLYLFHERGNNKKYERVSFCFFGLIDLFNLLVNDGKTITPNIPSLKLCNFSEDELSGIFSNEKNLSYNQKEILRKRIFYWTNGHPYLTQTLCKELTRLHAIEDKFLMYETSASKDSIASVRKIFEDTVVSEVVYEQLVNDAVDLVVKQFFLNKKNGNTDINLKYIEDSILKHSDCAQLMDYYYALIEQKADLKFDLSNRLQLFLFFTGLLNIEGSDLRVNNRICQNYFNKEWCDDYYNKRSPFEENLKKWQENEESSAFLLTKAQVKQAKKWKSLHEVSISKYEEKFIEESEKVFFNKFIRKLVVSIVAGLILIGGAFSLYTLIEMAVKKEYVVIVKDLTYRVLRLQHDKHILGMRVKTLENEVEALKRDSVANRERIEALKVELTETKVKLKTTTKLYETTVHELDSIKKVDAREQMAVRQKSLPAVEENLRMLLAGYFKKVAIVSLKTNDFDENEFYDQLFSYFVDYTKLTGSKHFELSANEIEYKESDLMEKKNTEFASQGFDLVIFATTSGVKERTFRIYTSRRGSMCTTLGSQKDGKKPKEVAESLAKELRLYKK